MSHVFSKQISDENAKIVSSNPPFPNNNVGNIVELQARVFDTILWSGEVVFIIKIEFIVGVMVLVKGKSTDQWCRLLYNCWWPLLTIDLY